MNLFKLCTGFLTSDTVLMPSRTEIHMPDKSHGIQSVSTLPNVAALSPKSASREGK
jgi:hypothetical protein